MWPDSVVSLGRFDENSALEIWQGAGYNELRRAMGEKRYSSAGCTECLKYKLRPNDNTPFDLMLAYLNWRLNALGSDSLQQVASKIALTTNLADILGSTEITKTLSTSKANQVTVHEIEEFAKTIESVNGCYPLLEGCVDYVASDRVYGWLWSPIVADFHAKVTVLQNGIFVARGSCNQPREDLRHAGKGNGLYGFEISFSEHLPDCANIKVVVDNTGCEIPRGKFGYFQG